MNHYWRRQVMSGIKKNITRMAGFHGAVRLYWRQDAARKLSWSTYEIGKI